MGIYARVGKASTLPSCSPSSRAGQRPKRCQTSPAQRGCFKASLASLLWWHHVSRGRSAGLLIIGTCVKAVGALGQGNW